MTGQPPSPLTPPSPSTIATPPTDTGLESRIQVTTPQLTTQLEAALGTSLDETVLEAHLLELDRRGHVEWVTITRTGEHVWDLTETPERLADALAAALIDRVHSWLERHTE